ncbi:MAG: hypothetical protein U0Y10_02440 [Spirosomataceae bacterium]
MKNTLFVSVFLLFRIGALAQNLVPNAQFEVARPLNESYNPSMQCYSSTCKELSNLFRYAPAQNWTVWLGTYQNYACVMTELLKAGSNCIPPWPNYVMGNMMHVKTTVGGSGIVNSDIPAGTNKVRISCWVFVVKGKVYFGYGPTGNSIVHTNNTSMCRWERLEIIKSGTEACNQVIIYADNNIDSEFYVDAVSVEVLK